MSHLYKLVQNANEHMPEAYQKWYARPVYTGTIDLDGIAERIQRNSTAKKSDAKAVLTEMVEVITGFAKSSHRRLRHLQDWYLFEGSFFGEGLLHHGEPEGRARAVPA